jgi:copper chaperone NosL
MPIRISGMKQLISAGLFGLILWGNYSCNPAPKAIAYGTDSCYFCRMTIVDQQRAAEIVTLKGKVYKFDAVECMVHSKGEIGTENIALYLCNTFNKPADLADATTAGFLESEALPSPMGANLTAFTNVEEATMAMEEYGGKVYLWESLLTYLGGQNSLFEE